MVLRRFQGICLIVVLLLCMAKASIGCAQDFSFLDGKPYLQNLTDDSLRYAWNLYEKGVKWQEKRYPSLCFQMLEEADEIFYRHVGNCDCSRENIELFFRNLEISINRNRVLIDKEVDSSLRMLNLMNLMKVVVNLARIQMILEKHFENTDSLFVYYNDWLYQYKIRYMFNCGLYDLRAENLQEVWSDCKSAWAMAQNHDNLFFQIDCCKRAIEYLLHSSPRAAEKKMNGLAQILSPVFTKDEILRNGTMPVFYLYAVQVARIYEKQGKLKEAVRTYRILLAHIRKCLNPEFPYLLPEEKEEIGMLLRYYLEHVQNFSLRHIHNESVGELLLDHSLLKEELWAAAPSPVVHASRHLYPTLLDWQRSADSLLHSSDYYLLPGDPDYVRKLQLQSDLMDLKRRQVSLVKRFSSPDADFTLLEDWRSLQKELEPHEAIIRIIGLPINFISRQYVALVITSDSSHPDMVLLPSKSELPQLAWNEAGKESMWKSIQHFLNRQTELYLCLDGDLVDFPWNTIVYQGKSLPEFYSLHFLLSVKDFIRLKRQPSEVRCTERNLYGFGGAYFTFPSRVGGIRGQGVHYLPGSREELCSVDTILPERWKSHLFLGGDASKCNFQQLSYRVSPNSVIHIATHGFTLLHNEHVRDGRFVFFKEDSYTGMSAYENPMLRSGFLLTGANRYWNQPVPYIATDSGIVTAFDVSQMNLAGTDLVILSACKSASGEIKDGEGMFGLIRAFKQAGAKTVLANLSDISDRETVQFITTFYRHWIKGNTTIFNAFRKTRQELMTVVPQNAILWNSFVLFE